MTRALCGAATLGLLLAAAGQVPGSDPSERLALLDLDGFAVDPFAGGSLTVLVFVRADCPISNRYAPELARLHREYAPRGVRFWLIYPDPEATPESIREHLAEYAYPLSALRDPRHLLVERVGATITPEAAVFTSPDRRVYRGRIDDRHAALGKSRPAPTVHDLEEAIERTLAGQAPRRATTSAVGCFIADLE